MLNPWLPLTVTVTRQSQSDRFDFLRASAEWERKKTERTNTGKHVRLLSSKKPRRVRHAFNHPSKRARRRTPNAKSADDYARVLIVIYFEPCETTEAARVGAAFPLHRLMLPPRFLFVRRRTCCRISCPRRGKGMRHALLGRSRPPPPTPIAVLLLPRTQTRCYYSR